MDRKYTATSGQGTLAASTTVVAVQLATGASVSGTVIGWDITFDSVATGSGAVPVRVQLVRPTGASSGGSVCTPGPWRKGDIAANITSRINDTVAGASPAVIKEWLVSPTGGLPYLFPYARELDLAPSDFLELKLISQAGMTTCHYVANLDFVDA